MKRSVSLVLLALFILALCACNAAPKDLPQDTTAPQDSADTEKIFDREPALTLTYENVQTELSGISLEWKYLDEKRGLWVSRVADYISMLSAKDRVRSITLGEELTVYMEWEVFPDEIIISCRNGDAWGNFNAPSEHIRVNYENGYSFTLKDGNYIYEIVAEWNRFENWNGEAEYWFYTTKD